MKKKLISALLCVAMVSSMLVGCGSGAAETPAAEAPAAEGEAEAEAPAAEEPAAEAPAASADGGKVYYLNP